MSTDLEKEMKEIHLEEAELEKKDENQITSKIAKPKRNPFEKIIDESINICEEIIEKDQSELGVDKLLKIMEKEIMKKEEFYNLVKLYEKTKNVKLKENQTSFEETNLKGDFNEIKTDLQNIKNLYENKKKTINKIKSEDKDKDEKLEQPSKKKKTTHKKNSEIVDVSNIVAKLPKIEENEENVEKMKIDECRTPVMQEKVGDLIEFQQEDANLKSPAQNKNNDLNDNKVLSAECGLVKNSVTKDLSAKKIKIENNNKTIMNFFKPKSEMSIGNSATNSVAKHKKYSEDNVINCESEVIPMKVETNIENEIININNSVTKEIKDAQQEIFFKRMHNPNFSTLDYRIENLISDSQTKINFYKIKGYEINNISDYHDSLKNYFEEISQIKKKQTIKTKNKKRKVIYIHDSFMTHRKISDKSSNLINPRNPFKKDEYLIDYDKDSEEEFLEENAEDIKSNENSADEEEILEDEEEEANRWIVPDGHLSEDEVSQKDENENTIGNLKNKKSVMEILEIRKNYSKPVIVNFNLTINSMDNKIKLLQNLCRAKIFNLNPVSNNDNIINKEDNNNDNEDNINSITNNKITHFPIKLTSKKLEETGRKTGMNNNIKDKLEELVREIHLSYMTKEYLIKVITDKYNDISKKSLSNFFKDSVLKVKCKNTLRKQWLVKKEILESVNFLTSEYNQQLEKQNSVYEEKEKEKKKEIEENQLNNLNIMNEQKGLTFTNLEMNPATVFNLNNLNNFNLNNIKNIQMHDFPEPIPTLSNNQFNIKNYNVNLSINNNELPLNKILNSTEKSKTKRVKKEKTSPSKPKTKSKVKLTNKSSKKEKDKSNVNDHQFDLGSSNLFAMLKKRDSTNT